MLEENSSRTFGKEISNTYNNIYNTNINSLIKSEKELLNQTKKSPTYYSYINSNYSINLESSNKKQLLFSNSNRTEIQNKNNIFTFKLPNDDIKNSDNLTQDELKEYLNEIIINMLTDEKINSLNYSYDFFNKQDSNNINEKHRGVLIDWLSHSSANWEPNDETLFLSINIIDRYISKKKISLEKFQLLGITSYFIASKFEYMNLQILDELVLSCKNLFTANNIIEMEHDILTTLNFDICFISSYKFLYYFYIFGEFNNSKLFYLSQLILEICCLNIEIMTFSQSKRAICSLLIAKKCLQIKTGNENNIINLCKMNECEIKEIQKKIVLFLNFIIRRDKECLILEKFTRYKYMKVTDVFIRKNVKSQDWLCY